MRDFAMSANVHNPRVEDIYDLGDDVISIQLGGNGYDHVSVITTEDDWAQIVFDVDKKLAELRGERKAKGAEK